MSNDELADKECLDCFHAMQIKNIHTTALIAELEKRRPCEKCKDYGQIVCGNCVWDSIGQDDNFKPKEVKS
jgi:hypothetical protein